ncbi:H-type lectin domain-containing protein [Pseudohalocynthiibacter aestuariivivens]|uniref:H-type lectin domain-containing protein n=1 Tax=Pseudohalocynthiibacter aestuariivivens TaxID=1591409 RepID=A0ABV5JEI9_9RHOB|nr:H-type lectin domain-containing protein [Pseudohalocynthiibacter aestuariivivens]MBS9717209.1 H-type lectin domain-containing protein [Pseudohalocynthiibacter aestuariivivens]
MKRLHSHLVGVDQGEKTLFSDFEDGGDMWTGTGPRASRARVKFSSSFQSIPVVQVSMSMWDMDRLTNKRADIQAENISKTGFDLVFRTWADSRVARIRASWIAIGDLPDEEEWELY